MHLSSKAALIGLAALTSAAKLRTDSGTYGPELEVAHLFYDQWPTGIAVSSTGRMFSNFPAGLDPNNTNNGHNGKYQVAELLKDNTQKAYPSMAFNTPPMGAINHTNTPPTSSNYRHHFIGVQSVVIDAKDRLWALDTGRAIDPKSGVLTNALPGGPKLICFDLKTDKVEKTIYFPPTVAYPDSYLNDVRFDLRTDLSHVGDEGVAYITDSSVEGRNGIIIVDIKSGNSWRHLTGNPNTRPEAAFVPFVWGQPVYGYMANEPRQYVSFGTDGIALSADGELLYFCTLASRYVYAVPTNMLRKNTQVSESQVGMTLMQVTQKGVTDGMETDSHGKIYMGNVEQEAVVFYNPMNATVETFVRDPRINWVDTMSVSGHYLYFTVNQLNFSPQTYPGTDRREHPYVLFRAPLPNGATKVMLGGS